MTAGGPDRGERVWPGLRRFFEGADKPDNRPVEFHGERDAMELCKRFLARSPKARKSYLALVKATADMNG